MNGRIYRNTIDGNGAGSIIIAGQRTRTADPRPTTRSTTTSLEPVLGPEHLDLLVGGGPTGTGNRVHDNVYWKAAWTRALVLQWLLLRRRVLGNPTSIRRTPTGRRRTSPSAPAARRSATGWPQPPLSSGRRPDRELEILAGATLSGNVKWTVTPNVPVASVEFAVNGGTRRNGLRLARDLRARHTLLPNGDATLSFTAGARRRQALSHRRSAP